MDADQIWKWEQQILQGNIKRTNVSIVLMDEAGQEKWRWNFKDAYPVKWSGPDLRAGTAEVAVETLELAHRGFLEGSGRKRLRRLRSEEDERRTGAPRSRGRSITHPPRRQARPARPSRGGFSVAWAAAGV